MKNVMQVEVVSNERSIYEGEAEFVVIPTVTGELGVLPRHEPVMTLVRAGVLRLTVPNQQEEVLVGVSGGIVEIHPDKITVLADVAVRTSEMDEERAKAAKKAAQEKMAAATAANDERTREQAKKALETAIAELKTLDYIRTHKHR